MRFTDQEHSKDQEDEEETPEENREERHAGSGAELADAKLAEAERKNQSAEKVTRLGEVSPKQMINASSCPHASERLTERQHSITTQEMLIIVV